MAELIRYERAPAKVNLDLLVLGRRHDGYHELDSLVVFGLAEDELILEPAAEFSLAVEGPFADCVPHGEANLVLRAARDFALAFGAPAGARLRLVKNIPVAAGLGGGSADAAACLRGLAALAGLRPALSDLLDVAAGLGADVPVCLYARPARMRGLGQRLDPVRGLPPLPMVLVNPGTPVATERVFRALRAVSGRGARAPLPASATLPLFAAWLEKSRNDLEPATLSFVPAVGEVLEALRAQADCLVARMSGSGGTCYGLFASPAAAHAAAARLRGQDQRWWVVSGVLEAPS